MAIIAPINEFLTAHVPQASFLIATAGLIVFGQEPVEKRVITKMRKMRFWTRIMWFSLYCIVVLPILTFGVAAILRLIMELTIPILGAILVYFMLFFGLGLALNKKYGFE